MRWLQSGAEPLSCGPLAESECNLIRPDGFGGRGDAMSEVTKRFRTGNGT